MDDHAWPHTDTVFPPHRLPSGWRGSGWFRLHFAVDSTLGNRPLALSALLWGASEIYLDGRLIARLGIVGSPSRQGEEFATTNPDLPPPRSVVFGRSGEHILAVRYSNFLLMKKAPNISHGFQIILRELDPLVTASIGQNRANARLLMLGTLVPAVFAAVHLLLFIFYPRARQNLYFAILTTTIAAAVYFSSSYEFSFVTALEKAFLYKNLGQIFALLMVLAGLRFLYAIFYAAVPKQFWLFLIFYGAVVLWMWRSLFIPKIMPTGTRSSPTSNPSG